MSTRKLKKSAKTPGPRESGWRQRQNPESQTAPEHTKVPPPSNRRNRIKLSSRALAEFRSHLPERNLSAFLGDFPDNRPLSDLLLLGTHETLSYYGYPISQCQSQQFQLEAQFEHGVRVLDVRLSVVDNTTLIAYHGIISQRTAFTAVVETLQQLLNLHKTECVVMSIKQEDFASTPALTFSTLVKNIVYANRDLWYLEDRVPTLGEVRGKIVLFSRFDDSGAGWPNGDSGIGIHPTTWPDTYKGTFEWDCNGTTVRTQDWYKIPSFLSIPEKFELATSPLIQPPNPPTPTPTPTLVITFTSASNIPLALPPMVALGAGINSARACRLLGYPGVNQRVRNWLLLHLQQVQTVELEREREREREREQQEDKIEEKVGSSSSPKNRELGEVSEEPDLVVTDKIRGWVMMDYADTPNDLLPLLVECNYH